MRTSESLVIQSLAFFLIDSALAFLLLACSVLGSGLQTRLTCDTYVFADCSEGVVTFVDTSIWDWVGLVVSFFTFCS